MAKTASDITDADSIPPAGPDGPAPDESADAPPRPAVGAAIDARGLSRTYGPRGGVRSVDLEVEAGTILGVIGPSGCGKTTLLRTLAGISMPTGGEVLVLGRAPATFTAADRARIGYLPQLPVLFPNLSVWSNLNFAASLYGVGLHRRRWLKALLRFVDLYDDRHKRFRSCSGGMQRRLALAAALVHDPELLLLDEPTAGLDPILRERFWAHFRALRDEGRTLVVSTQHVGEAAMCDQVALFAEGRLLTVGTPAELRRDAFGGDVVEARPTSGWLSRDQLRALAAEPWALAVTQEAEAISVVVDDGAAGVDLVARHLAGAGIPVEGIEHAARSYDEAFIELIERAEAEDADGGPGGREAPAATGAGMAR